MLRFVIPNAPGKNQLYRNVSAVERERCAALGKPRPRGRRRTQTYNTWRNAAAWAMKLDGTKSRTWQPFTGPVIIEIVTGSHRHDNDATVPAVFDLLQTMGVVLNDAQIVKHSVERSPQPSRETTVTVWAVNEVPQRKAA